MKKPYLRPMTKEDLELVFEWRNAPQIRDFMLTQQEITFADHLEWFNSASKNPTRVLLIFEADDMPTGHINFKMGVSGRVADWGFYTAPDAPKGTGRIMGATALQFGFAALGLHKICGQVLDFNIASLKMHEALGFIREGVLRQHQYINGSWCDITCYGLLAQEWFAHKGNNDGK